jgi:galactokinase
MFGKKEHALHLDCRNNEAKPYKIDFKDHQLMLINTNVMHSLSDSAYNDRRATCENISKLLNIKALRDATEDDLEKVIDKVTPANYQKALFVIQENSRTLKAAKAIEDNNLEKLGSLIYESHQGLSNQYKVSCDELDFLVNQAKKNKYVLGARMMGGGFGGCTINLIAKDEAETFAKTTSKAYEKEFNKVCSVYFIKLSEGTHIVK